MSRTQAFQAFVLIMRCLFWIMRQINGPGIRPIEKDYETFMQEQGYKL